MTARFSFSPPVLRRLIPLQIGDLFNVARSEQASKSQASVCTRGLHRYDNGAVTEIDEATKPSTRYLGLIKKRNIASEPSTTRREYVNPGELMESLPKTGRFLIGPTRRLLQTESRDPASDASIEDVNVRRDLKSKTVAISLDLRTCPQYAN